MHNDLVEQLIEQIKKLEKEGFEGLPSRSMVILTASFMLTGVVALIIIFLD